MIKRNLLGILVSVVSGVLANVFARSVTLDQSLVIGITGSGLLFPTAFYFIVVITMQKNYYVEPVLGYLAGTAIGIVVALAMIVTTRILEPNSQYSIALLITIVGGVLGWIAAWAAIRFYKAGI